MKKDYGSANHNFFDSPILTLLPSLVSPIPLNGIFDRPVLRGGTLALPHPPFLRDRNIYIYTNGV